MNSVKVVMGFLEFAAAMKFLSNADLVWHWKRLLWIIPSPQNFILGHYKVEGFLPRSPNPAFSKVFDITQMVHVKFKLDYPVIVLLSPTAELSHSVAELLGITNTFLTYSPLQCWPDEHQRSILQSRVRVRNRSSLAIYLRDKIFQICEVGPAVIFLRRNR
jgi:hypothetical protein